MASPLPVVFARQDGEPKLALCKWTPRVVECRTTQDDETGLTVPYVVKFRRSREAAAALISEVVCHGVFEAIGLRTLDPALVEVGPRLAFSYSLDKSIGYPIPTGLHFGTIERDAQPGPPVKWEQMFDPAELIRIWVADSWVMNLDREVFGNILMELDKPSGKFHMIPADQSDCFHGAEAFSSGEFVRWGARYGMAPFPHKSKHNFVEQALAKYDCHALHATIDEIQACLPKIPGIMSRVPREWWGEAQIDSRSVIQVLRDRANRLRQIIDVDHWVGLSNAARQGRSFELGI